MRVTENGGSPVPVITDVIRLKEQLPTKLNAILSTQLYVLWDVLHRNVGGITTVVVTSLICCIGNFHPSGTWPLRSRDRETFTARFGTIDLPEFNCGANFAIRVFKCTSLI